MSFEFEQDASLDLLGSVESKLGVVLSEDYEFLKNIMEVKSL